MEIRWATPADFALLPRVDVYCRAIVLILDGRPAAIASIFYERGQTVPTAAVDFLAEVRPLTKHRFGKAVMAKAREIGLRRLMALADCKIPRSDAWLEALGFVRVAETERGAVYLWQARQEASKRGSARSTAGSKKTGLPA